ncbi:MAG: MarC family protein [Oligoflexales bacterium]
MFALQKELSFLVSMFISVFVIVDPFAVIPIFIGITEKYTSTERTALSAKSCVIATVILVLFCLLGSSIFKVFGITLEAFQIAGGILLLLLGLAQLNAERRRVKKEEESESLDRDNISVFPLATPLLAGPGAISTVVLLSSKANNFWQMFLLIVAVALSLFCAFLLLRSAHLLLKVLGRTGLNLLTRIMGILLVAIAIQFIINGVKTAFNL